MQKFIILARSIIRYVIVFVCIACTQNDRIADNEIIFGRVECSNEYFSTADGMKRLLSQRHAEATENVLFFFRICEPQQQDPFRWNERYHFRNYIQFTWYGTDNIVRQPPNKLIRFTLPVQRARLSFCA